MHADPLETEDLSPDPGDRLFHRSARGHVLRTQPRTGSAGGGQGLAVHLAASGQRQLVQEHKRTGHHVAGEGAAAPLAKVRHARFRFARHRHRIGHEPAVTGGVLAKDDGDGPQVGVADENRLDFTEFDAETANLDLVVETPEVLQLTVGRSAHQIPRTIHPAHHPADLPLHEPLSRQLRTLQIATGHANARNPQLPRHADRHRASGPIEHERPRAGQRTADRRHRPIRGIRRSDLPSGHMHDRLRDPIHVHQPRTTLAHGRPPRPQPRRVQRLATQHDQPQRQLARQTAIDLLLQQTKSRRRLVQHRHPPLHQQPGESSRVPRHLPINDDQTTAIRERTPDLPHRKIEREGMEQRPHVIRAEPEIPIRAPQPIHHTAMLDQHTLRHTRRTRRINAIREIIRRDRRNRVLAQPTRDQFPISVDTHSSETDLRQPSTEALLGHHH